LRTIRLDYNRITHSISHHPPKLHKPTGSRIEERGFQPVFPYSRIPVSPELSSLFEN
jgi:hypothetical protein